MYFENLYKNLLYVLLSICQCLKNLILKKWLYEKKDYDTSDYIIPLEAFKIKQRESKLGRDVD